MADLADVRFLHSRRFYQQFWLFALYFIISLVCFTMRPILVPDAEPAVATSASAGLVVDVTTYETPLSTAYPAPTNVNGSPPSLSASSPEPPPPLLAPGLTLMTDADVAESGADDLQLAGAEQATPTDSGEVEVNASRYDQDACYLSKVRWMDLFFFNWLSTLDCRSSVLFFTSSTRRCTTTSAWAPRSASCSAPSSTSSTRPERRLSWASTCSSRIWYVSLPNLRVFFSVSPKTKKTPQPDEC